MPECAGARHVREWLSAQAASGYVEYEPASERFGLSDEQAFALTVEGGPAFIPGAFEIAVAQFKAIPKMISAFRTGLGPGWHEHNLNPVGRIFYSASTFICTPASRSQEVGACLGAQAGKARIRDVATRPRLRARAQATSWPMLACQIRYQSSALSAISSAATASRRASVRDEPVMRIGLEGWRRIQA